MRSPPTAVMAVAALLLLLLVSLAANTTALPDRKSELRRKEELYERVMVEWKAGHGKNIRNEEETRRVFAEWMVKHGKRYSSAGEEDRRYALFKDELRRVDLLNAAFNAAFGPNSFYGIDFFSDFTDKEWGFLTQGALPYESTKPISRVLQQRQEWRLLTQGAFPYESTKPVPI